MDHLDDVPEVAGHAHRLLLHDLLRLLRRGSGGGTVDCSHSTRYGQICLRPSSVCSWWNVSVFSSSELYRRLLIFLRYSSHSNDSEWIDWLSSWTSGLSSLESSSSPTIKKRESREGGTLFQILDLPAPHDQPVDFKRSFQRKLRNFGFENVVHRNDFGFRGSVRKHH